MPCSSQVCDNYPFEIGTDKNCKLYNVYYKKSEIKTIGITTTTTTDASENLAIYTAPLYSGIYSSNLTPIPIGYITYFSPSTSYSPSVTTALNTAYYSYYWIEQNTLRASISAVYNYIGDSSSDDSFFAAGSTHYYNSITCNQQLLNNKAGFKTVVDSANEVRQVRIKIKC